MASGRLTRARATPRTYLTLVCVFCLALPLAIWAGAAALGERVGDVGRPSALGDDSWHDRATSLGLAGLAEKATPLQP